MTDNTTLLYRQDYAGSLEYRFTTANGLQPEAAYFGDGRVYYNAGTWRYEYYLKDHLGNIRLTFTDKNNNGVVDVNNTANNEILQENHYYPFGMDQSGPWMNDAALDNAYKYNGKELNADFGLQWMDYGARWYDGALGRWFSVDPMVGALTAFSPYAYGALNPINNIDLFGLYPMNGSSNDNGTGVSTSSNPGFEEMRENNRKEIENGAFWNGMLRRINSQTASATITVTNKRKGTAKLVDDFFDPSKTKEGYNDLYYNVPTYEMNYCGIKENGEYVESDYEVLRFGVKRGSFDGLPYFQGFGAPNYSSVDLAFTLSEFFTSGTYKNGAFRVSGSYLLHSGPFDPLAIPTVASSRLNFGCIAVCGGRSSGWQNLLDNMRSTFNVGTNYEIPVSFIQVIVEPIDIPSHIPAGISINNK